MIKIEQSASVQAEDHFIHKLQEMFNSEPQFSDSSSLSSAWLLNKWRELGPFDVRTAMKEHGSHINMNYAIKGPIQNVGINDMIQGQVNKEGKAEGYARFVYRDDNIHQLGEGFFYEDQLTGYGRTLMYNKKEQSYYVGYYVNDDTQGRGKCVTSRNGHTQIHEGLWKNGIFMR